MHSVFIAGSVLAYFICAKYPEQIDAKLISYWRWFLNKIKKSPAASAEFLQLLLISRLLSTLRAGISLESALEEALQDSSLPGSLQIKLKNLLSGRPEKDFVSQLIFSALESGISCTNAMQSLQKIFRVKIRMRQKIDACSAQAKAQAEVLSWLPWAMALLICLVDTNWFATAVKSPLTWLLWSISLAITGMGKFWFDRIIQRALLPQSPLENLLENSFPDLLIRVIANVAIGKDPQSALEISLSQSEDPFLTQQFIYHQNPDAIVHFKSILKQANKGASGLREELMALLHDLHSAQESKWEERAQKISVHLMAPLFICFFPSTILVIASLLWASIEGVM